MRMQCLKCKSTDVKKAGMYRIKRTNIARERFRCKNCGFSFTVRTTMFRKKISIHLIKKILRLWKTEKPNKNKFDGTGKITYSTREIARLLGVSKTYVWNVVKKEE